MKIVKAPDFCSMKKKMNGFFFKFRIVERNLDEERTFFFLLSDVSSRDLYLLERKFGGGGGGGGGGASKCLSKVARIR